MVRTIWLLQSIHATSTEAKHQRVFRKPRISKTFAIRPALQPYFVLYRSIRCFSSLVQKFLNLPKIEHSTSLAARQLPITTPSLVYTKGNLRVRNQFSQSVFCNCSKLVKCSPNSVFWETFKILIPYICNFKLSIIYSGSQLFHIIVKFFLAKVRRLALIKDTLSDHINRFGFTWSKLPVIYIATIIHRVSKHIYSQWQAVITKTNILYMS